MSPLLSAVASTVVLVALATSNAFTAQERPSPSALIERAATALGGQDVITAMVGVRVAVAGAGISSSAVQARDPRASYNLLTLERSYLLDFAGARGTRESSQVSPGSIRFHTLAIATQLNARTIDLLMWRSGTDIQPQSAEVGKAALAAWARLTPQGTIRQALESRATLKDGGRVERDGQWLDAVTYVDSAGATVTVHLDGATGLPVSASPGEIAASVYEYGDYHQAGTLRVPQRLSVRVTGLYEELRIVALDFAPSLTAAQFELPSGYSDAPALGQPRAVRIGEGVYRVDGMPANYHTAFVIDGRSVSVFDAPQSAQWSEIVLGIIRETAGAEARVDRVLVSHHHADHTGGLAPYVAAGAAIVSGAANVEFLRGRLPEAVRGAAKFEPVTASRTFGAGATRIEAHPVPNEHADGTLVFYLPGHKLLLQGDLFYVPERGPVPPAFGVTADLARVIDDKNLDVESLLGVHGRQGTIEELRHSLSLRSGLR